MSLRSLIDRQPPPMAGLDISTSSIKLVELAMDRAGEFVLERCALEPLENGWISEGDIENFEEVVDAARRVIRRSGMKAKQVAMALPASVVISKKIILPGGLTESEMELQVELEANQYIPFSLDEVSLDYCVMGPSAASVGDVEVMLAASRREKVEDLQGLAEAIGLTPVVIDVGTYASRLAAGRVIERLPGGAADAVVILIEIGGLSSMVQVLRDNELLYEREQMFGGAQLTQMLVRQYGFTYDEAELKKRSGDLPGDYRDVVLAPFVDTLAQEIERALKFFFTSTPHNRIDYILMAGGGAGLHGLTEAVTEHTSYPCQVINPFEGMTLGRGVREQRLQREAPSYLTACGLAMRRYLR